jgi:hypothetical protein
MCNPVSVPAEIAMNTIPESPLTEAIHLKISAPLYKALKRLAEKEDCTINHIARNCWRLA